MWLWTATYVKSLTVLDIEDLTREAYMNSKLKVEAKRKVTKEPKKANGDRGGSHLFNGCGIMMRSYEGRVRYDGTTRTGEGMEQVTFST